MHGNAVETPWATEPRAAALRPIVENTRPAPLTRHPVVTDLHGVGGPRPLPQRAADTPPRTSTRWQRARAATSRSAICPTSPGPIGLASDARLRAESAAGLRCLDDRPALQRMRSSASTVCLLAVVKPISSHVVPDMFHVKHVATTACSVMRVSTPDARRNAANGDGVGPSRGATTSRAYAMRALPAKRWAKPGRRSGDRYPSRARAPRVCRVPRRRRRPPGREPPPSRVHSARRV